jgi:ATP/maltotriose-dependent transcriptional regulator MalT
MLEDAADADAAAFNVAMVAQSLLALVDLEEEHVPEAAARLRSCAVPGETQDSLPAALFHTASVWLESAQDKRSDARDHLDRAVRLLPRTTVIPWLTIYLQIVTSRVAMAVDDGELAATLLNGARRKVARYPDAGVLPHMLARLEHDLAATRGGSGLLLEPLTQAELRVLELAPAYLTVEEIGLSLCVSRNTVKSHLKAIYAKLNVASRSEAVQRAKALRLIDR